VITSLTSPKVARVRRLLETQSPHERIESGQFVVEGLRAVEAALESKAIDVVEIFATAEWIHRFPQATEITEQVAKKISDTVTPQGIFAVLTLPRHLLHARDVRNARAAKRIAIFVELQDPGNAGTIIRNAHAFDFDLIVFGKGSVDPFSGKVARASAGSIASLPIDFGVDLAPLIESLSQTHQVIDFDMEGDDVASIDRTGPVAVIFGNEARGLPEEMRSDRRIKRIRIPMPGGTESLNVASAATIAMYEISRRD